MRVIAGKARGLKLISPPDNDVRPTTDRVKESMFNIIAPYVHGSRVLDLFGGSGALGIEALSRGAEKAYFCDKDVKSIGVIKENLKKARFTSGFQIIHSSYESAIESLSSKGEKFDIIFVDPPYYKGLFEDVISSIYEKGLLNEDGIIVVEHDAKTEIDDIEGLEIFKEKKYGITSLTFYCLEGGDTE